MKGNPSVGLLMNRKATLTETLTTSRRQLTPAQRLQAKMTMPMETRLRNRARRKANR